MMKGQFIFVNQIGNEILENTKLMILRTAKRTRKDLLRGSGSAKVENGKTFRIEKELGFEIYAERKTVRPNVSRDISCFIRINFSLCS